MQDDWPDPTIERLPIQTIDAIIGYDDNHRPIIDPLLPEPYSTYAKAVSDTTETPPCMATMCTLTTISTAVQDKFIVEYKQGWTETLNLYSIIIAEPGERKTAVSKAVTAPLLEWETMKQMETDHAYKIATSIYESKRAQVSNMKKKLKGDQNNQATIQDIANIEASLKVPDKPLQLIADDTTLERLARLAVEQKGRLSIVSDEGGGMDVMAGLYNSGGKSNPNILMQGWEKGIVRIDRADCHIRQKVILTINYMVQPVIIDQMSKQKAFAGRGLMDRFLILKPASKVGYRLGNDQSIPATLKNSYHEAVKRLLAIGYKEAPDKLLLDPKAKSLFDEWRAKHETESKITGWNYFIRGVANKLPGQVLRIAGLLHIAKYRSSYKEIEHSTIEKAINAGECFIEHARTVYSRLSDDPNMKLARLLFDFIYEKFVRESISDDEIITCKKKDLTKKMQNMYKAEDINKALPILIDDWQVIRPGKKEHKTQYYEINPKLYRFYS